jgi:hypothetical protein
MMICATASAIALDVLVNSGLGWCPFFVIAKADGIIADLNSRMVELKSISNSVSSGKARIQVIR